MYWCCWFYQGYRYRLKGLSKVYRNEVYVPEHLLCGKQTAIFIFYFTTGNQRFLVDRVLGSRFTCLCIQCVKPTCKKYPDDNLSMWHVDASPSRTPFPPTFCGIFQRCVFGHCSGASDDLTALSCTVHIWTELLVYKANTAEVPEATSALSGHRTSLMPLIAGMPLETVGVMWHCKPVEHSWPLWAFGLLWA